MLWAWHTVTSLLTSMLCTHCAVTCLSLTLLPNMQEMSQLLEPLSMMFLSKGYKVEDVIAEVRRMQTGWQHSDYRSWLKHYTTGKRPRSMMEDGKPLGRPESSLDGSVPREHGQGMCLSCNTTLLLPSDSTPGVYVFVWSHFAKLRHTSTF